jgi:hypothetical protein
MTRASKKKLFSVLTNKNFIKMSILPKYNKITLNKKEFKLSNSTKDGQQHNIT